MILGFGFGSVYHILTNELNISTNVVDVEIDESIIEVWKEFQDPLKRNIPLKIKIEDAFDFLESCYSKFDLVVVDVFQELDVPDKFQSNEFSQLLNKVTNLQGVVVFNYVINNSASQKKI